MSNAGRRAPLCPRRHDLVRRSPAASPWHGLLLGNGDMGAVVFGPEHALRFRINKLDLWDSRWPEAFHIDALPLSEFKRVAAEESRQLADGARIERFQKLPWSGADVPYPCMRTGADLILGVTSCANVTRPLQRLRLKDATHTCAWSFGHWDSLGIESEAFVCRDRNVLALRLSADAKAAGFLSLALRREPMGGRDDDMLRHGEWGTRNWRDPRSGMLPAADYRCDGGMAMMTQLIPGDAHGEPFTYAVVACCDGGDGFAPGPGGEPVTLAPLAGRERGHCYAAIATDREGPDPAGRALALAQQAAQDGFARLRRGHRGGWRRYWSASRVDLAPRRVERTWYRESYRLACHVRPDGPPPSLFGVGIPYDCPPWRGDRHNNWPEYASLFWGAFASNHVELVRNYVLHIEAFLPHARELARKYFECERGAAFPHVYIDHTRRIYFDNLWSRSLYLTAITVLNAWWHYQYSRDVDFLDHHGYALLREAADFYVELVAKNKPGDYALWPTVPPEYRGFLKDLALSRNCIMDLPLVKLLMRAAIETSTLLGRDADRRALWRKLLEHLPAYPTLEHDRRTVFADVEGNAEPAPYNHPIGIAPLFPGEDPECFGEGRWAAIAEATLRSRNWKDFQDIAYARLGDAHKAFGMIGGAKRPHKEDDHNITYANGAKRVQAVCELLLSSWDGVIRVFHAWPREHDARFENLRAVGAFLVSAACVNGIIGPITILSEAGGPAVVALPWSNGAVDGAEPFRIEDGLLRFDTRPGSTYRITPL